MNAKTGRAPRMSVEQRRAHILDAVTPLLIEHGADVTTRQIAEAAGVAEGTIFRAFRDKEELIAGVVGRCMDPTPIITSLSAIAVDQPLEDKLRQIVAVLRERYVGVLAIMNALGIKEPPMEGGAGGAPTHGVPVQGTPMHDVDLEGACGATTPNAAHTTHRRGAISERLLEPHRDEMGVTPAKAVALIRLLCFSASVPSIAGEIPLSDDDLLHFILRGITKEGH